MMMMTARAIAISAAQMVPVFHVAEDLSIAAGLPAAAWPLVRSALVAAVGAAAYAIPDMARMVTLTGAH